MFTFQSLFQQASVNVESNGNFTFFENSEFDITYG